MPRSEKEKMPAPAPGMQRHRQRKRACMEKQKKTAEITVDRAETLQKCIPILCSWYREKKRDLPWRHGKNAYHTWVSEIMLQQTRVEAVKGYYQRFLEALPSVQDLAECPEDRLLKLWEGLGYYNRVRNMQKAAKEIVAGSSLPMSWFGESGEQEGAGNITAAELTTEKTGEDRVFPALLALPGIGRYTAGAIASIAFAIPVPAVDGNVLRVLSRVFADAGDISRQAVRHRYEEMLQAAMLAYFHSGSGHVKPVRIERMQEDLPGDFNQSFMDLGAMVCLPNGAPLCGSCPLAEARLCRAHLDSREQDFPVKAQKKDRRIENRTILLIRDGEQVILQKRPETGLLASLYEFPNLPGTLTRPQALGKVEEMGFYPIRIRRLGPAKHIFSHVEWHMTGFEIRVAEFDSGEAAAHASSWILAGIADIRDRYAIPSAYAAYLGTLQTEDRKGTGRK